MKWWLVSTSFFLASLICSPAQGKDLKVKLDSPELQLDRAFQLYVNEAKGVWFPADMAREMQVQVEEYRETLTVVESQKNLLNIRKERLGIKDARIFQLREALDLSIKSEERSQGVVTAAVRGQRQAEEAMGAWYRAPTLWLFIGVGVGITVTSIAVKALHEAAK
jgi:hypothetical protein